MTATFYIKTNNLKTKTMKTKIKICKEYKKSKYDNICANCNSNKSYCNYTRTLINKTK